MTGMLRVRNWEKFQHYHDRNPPWIKLHFEILSSPDWVLLDDAGRVLAVACMLIASRNKGLVPANPEYLRRVAYLSSVDFKPLIDCGFLEPASTRSEILATASTDTETETDNRQMPGSLPGLASASPKQENPAQFFPTFYSLYPRHEARAKAEKAWKSLAPNAELRGKILEAITWQKKSGCLRAHEAEGRSTIPLPASWLNARRWEDEPPRPTGTPRVPISPAQRLHDEAGEAFNALMSDARLRLPKPSINGGRVSAGLAAAGGWEAFVGMDSHDRLLTAKRFVAAYEGATA